LFLTAPRWETTMDGRGIDSKVDPHTLRRIRAPAPGSVRELPMTDQTSSFSRREFLHGAAAAFVDMVEPNRLRVTL